MGNYIVNGDFASGFDNWNNGLIGYPFTIENGKAKASSVAGAITEKQYVMRQEFYIPNDVTSILSATITVEAEWENYDGPPTDGYTKFRVTIRRPDGSWFIPYPLTSKDGVGSGKLLDDYDVSGDFDQRGNYKLDLQCYVASSDDNRGGEQSFGWYDNISVNITVKKSKMVKESIGAKGVIPVFSAIADSVSIAELVSGQLVFIHSEAEGLGLTETYTKKVQKAVMEGLGVEESWLSDPAILYHSESEVVGLSESAWAKRIRGNVETTYHITDLTDWEEVAGVTTQWRKQKVEV